MPERHSQLLAMGPELWKEARLSGRGVNESYLYVHRVLSAAFREDLGDMPEPRLREHLSRLLQQHLHTAG
jgi:hypothetical protein